MTKKTPSNCRPSPFGDAVDQIMAKVAILAGDSKWTTEPAYAFGYELLDKTSGRPPQVRAYLAAGRTDQSAGKAAAGKIGNLFTWQQDVTFRVWGANHKQCVDLAGNILIGSQQVNLASGTLNIPIADVTFDWLNDMVAETADGQKMEFTLSIPVAISNAPKGLATITAFSGSFSGSLTSSIQTSGSIVYPPSGQWSMWKDDIIVSGSNP